MAENRVFGATEPPVAQQRQETARHGPCRLPTEGIKRLEGSYSYDEAEMEPRSRPDRTAITASSYDEVGVIAPPSRPHRTTISPSSRHEQAIQATPGGHASCTISVFQPCHKALIAPPGLDLPPSRPHKWEKQNSKRLERATQQAL